MKKNNKLLLFWILFIVYLEAVFRGFIFNSISTSSIYVVFFSILIGLFFFIITNLFKNKVNHILTIISISFLSLFFIAQFIYYQFYDSVFSIYSMFNGGGQILQFISHILSILLKNWYVILILLIPLMVFVILDIRKVFDYDSICNKKTIFIGSICLVIHFILVGSFFIIDNVSLYSNKNLYFNTHVPMLTVNNMGLLTTMRLDIKRSIFGFVEKELVIDSSFAPEVDEDMVEEEEEKVEYNVLDIDFDSLYLEESDEVIKDMHLYFKSQEPSKKNEYTGMFKGKNLIVFVAEAFSDIAIDEELTPTLYKLYQEGLQADNFYTPLFPVSTADGEYITDTSLLPKEGVWSLSKLAGNYMPYSYANVFENLGYTSNAYHNNTATYYKRDSYIKTMGYDSFKACKKGLDINCRIWPQSDLEMIEASVADYINDDRFLAYYMTVSGHLEYTRRGNMMVSKNWSYVKDLKYSNKAKSYLAANIELDRAIAKLIEKLEKAGKLDDTVIAISGDHYPYGLTIDEVNELSDYERDENFEIHHMPFLLWNSEMKENIVVEKYGSSLDVLPTILNLFGIEYDSRLLMGRDLLSDSDSLVIFSNRSFISDYGKYNSVNNEFLNFNGEVSEEYIDQINAIIYNKFKYSRLVLEKDYYRSLFLK